MKQIVAHVKQYRYSLLLIIVLTVFQTMSGLMTPTILSTLVSEGILKNDAQQMLVQGAFMMVMSVTELILAILVARLIGKFAAGLAKDLRRSMFNKIQHFSMQDFNQLGTSTYLNRTTRDIQSLSQTIGFSLSMILNAPILLIGSIILSVRINAQLSLVLLCSIPILGGVIAVLVYFISGGMTQLRQFNDTLTQIFRDTLTGSRVIRAFNKETYELERFDKVNSDFRKLLFKLNNQFYLIGPIVMITINFANLAVVLLGAQLIQASQLQIGELMAIIQYSSLVLIALLLLAFILIMIPQGIVSARRINEVLEQENTQDFPQEAKGLGSITEIQFSQVSFRYEGAERQTLTDVSFTAKTGERIAIIGSTGAGKSTLLGLLLRFLDATAGEILYNQTNIQDFTEEELRRQIAYVPQKRNLFAGTIRDNLHFGREDATDAEMIEALKMAEAWEFVSQLDGQLDARVEQGGENFSGGQKQRLAIARALIKNASVQIFDDSFSALDAKTEAKLRQNLKPLNERSIVFVVAQRISSVTDADQIIVLHEGYVAGIGKHKELAAHNEIYQAIMNSQTNLEEMEDLTDETN